MNDRTLSKISLLMAAVGLIGIVLVNLLWIPRIVTIGDITGVRLGEIVSIDADITQKNVKDGNVFLSLSDGTGTIRAVAWKSSMESNLIYNISVGMPVLITGQVTNYRGELEIVVSEIELL